MNRSETIGKFAVAFLAAQRLMENASKDSTNPHFRSKFADLNSVNDAVIPVLNANDIMVLQPCVIVDGRKFIETTLLHVSGEFVSALTEILSSKETSAQDQGSGITYARRYGLQALVCIGAEDDDGNKATFGTKTTPKVETVKVTTDTKTVVAKEEPKTTGSAGSKFKPRETAPKVESTDEAPAGWE